MRKLQESTNPCLISFDWELTQVCPANSSNEYIDRSKILMTTACIHVYNPSRSDDIGLRFCTPFICRRFVSGRQGRLRFCFCRIVVEGTRPKVSHRATRINRETTDWKVRPLRGTRESRPGRLDYRGKSRDFLPRSQL